MFNWLGNLRLDFFIPDKNIAIECQGEQHFNHVKYFDPTIEDFIKRQEYDKLKNSLCKDHNTKIIYYSLKKHKNCITDLNKILKLIKN